MSPWPREVARDSERLRVSRKKGDFVVCPYAGALNPSYSPRLPTAYGDWHPGPAGSVWTSTVTRGRDHRLRPSPSPVAALIEVESRHCKGAGPHLHRRHARTHALRTGSRLGPARRLCAQGLGHDPAFRLAQRQSHARRRGVAAREPTARKLDSEHRDSEHRVPSHLSRNIVFRVT